MVLSRVLDEAGLEHEFVGPELQAPGAFAEIVEALVDRASRATGDDDHDRALFADVAVVDGDAVLLGPVVAGRGRRFLAFVVEALIFDLVLLAVRFASPGGARLLGLGISVGSGLVLVALLGVTVGMAMFRMRVVVAGARWEVPGEIEPPGWRAALVRYLVVVWPAILLVVSQVVGADGLVRPIAHVSSVWSLCCFGPILFDPLHRGLHDRMARTLVIDVAR